MNDIDGDAAISTGVTNTTDMVSHGITEAEALAADTADRTRSLFDQAQGVLEQAVEATTKFVEERPIAAAAIAGGVALAAAGAVYGVARLGGSAGTPAEN